MRAALPSIPPGVAVACSPLEPLPLVVDPSTLAARAAGSMVVQRIEETVTALGWPCTVARGTQGDAYVLRAIVRMLDHAVLLEASAEDPDARERAWEVIAQVRPAWTELAAVHQLFA